MEQSSVSAQAPNGQPKSPAPMKITLNKRKLLLGVGVGLFIILIIAGVFFFRQPKNDTSAPTADIVATVNDEPVYRSYVATEAEFYPGAKTPEVEKMLTEKVINDQILLDAAKKDGLIKDSFNRPNLTKAEYLERVDQIAKLEQIVNEKANGKTISLVSIWYYNSQVPPKTPYEEGQRIAQQKITTLYNRVKNKEITMREAGQLIATDTQLAGLNVSYKQNAYGEYKVADNKMQTFWAVFNQQLASLKPGELTPIYNGTDTGPDGVEQIPAVYMFGKLDKEVTGSTITSYITWVDAIKKKYEITYK